MKYKLKRVLKDYNLMVCSAFLWLRIGKYINLLLSRKKTLSFHTKRQNFLKAEDLKKNWTWRKKLGNLILTYINGYSISQSVSQSVLKAIDTVRRYM